jgi:hypothetical protein
MGRWGAASALESTMQRLTGLLVLTLCTGLFVPNHSFARDDGRFTDTPLRQWFDQLRQRKRPVLLVCRWREHTGCRLGYTRRNRIIAARFGRDASVGKRVVGEAALISSPTYTGRNADVSNSHSHASQDQTFSTHRSVTYAAHLAAIIAAPQFVQNWSGFPRSQSTFTC